MNCSGKKRHPGDRSDHQLLRVEKDTCTMDGSQNVELLGGSLSHIRSMGSAEICTSTCGNWSVQIERVEELQEETWITFATYFNGEPILGNVRDSFFFFS